MADPARQRARLAKSFAEFWYGGDGPSHGELDDAFAVAGIEPGAGSKRDRVSEAIRTADQERLPTLLEELVELLRVNVLPSADTATVERLRSAMRPYGLELDDAYEIRPSGNPRLDHLPDQPALRDHIDRIQRALRDGDDAQLLGSTKELLETTAKVVLERTDAPTPSKFPALVTAAFEALEVHPKANASSGTGLEQPVRQILGGALQIVLGVDELRNAHGTGHGRTKVIKLSKRQARLAAGAGAAIAAFLLDTLDDPKAHWRRAHASDS
jgi:hypothetical protein